MALCRAMSMRIAWLRLMFALALLLQDAVRYLLLATRSSAALAENLFLRKPLALRGNARPTERFRLVTPEQPKVPAVPAN
jgi:hypothetical protein